MRRRTASGLLALLMCSAPLAACGPAGPGHRERPLHVTLADTPVVLDPARLSVVFPLDRDAAELAGHRLVEVEITEVVNPSAVRLTFEVRYRSRTGEQRLLGLFALFPPDNPGEFLVPTRGELSPGGELELAMIPLDEPESTAELRAVVGRVALRRD